MVRIVTPPPGRPGSLAVQIGKTDGRCEKGSITITTAEPQARRATRSGRKERSDCQLPFRYRVTDNDNEKSGHSIISTNV